MGDDSRCAARAQFDWLDNVADDAEISPTAFKLAFVIRRFINRHSGEAWPTQETLARLLRTSTRTVRTLTDQLVARGHLEVTPGRGRNASHIYRLALDDEIDERRRHASTVEKVMPDSGVKTGNGLPVLHQEYGSQLPVLPNKTGSGLPVLPQECGSQLPVLPQEYGVLPIKTGSPLPTEPGYEEKEVSKYLLIEPQKSNSRFEEFWAAYPRKVAKGKARAAYERALHDRKARHQELVAGAERYAGERRGADEQFTKHPATWLHGECWHDEAPPRRPASSMAGGRMTGFRSAAMGAMSYAQEDDER